MSRRRSIASCYRGVCAQHAQTSTHPAPLPHWSRLAGMVELDTVRRQTLHATVGRTGMTRQDPAMIDGSRRENSAWGLG